MIHEAESYAEQDRIIREKIESKNKLEGNDGVEAWMHDVSLVGVVGCVPHLSYFIP